MPQCQVLISQQKLFIGLLFIHHATASGPYFYAETVYRVNIYTPCHSVRSLFLNRNCLSGYYLYTMPQRQVLISTQKLFIGLIFIHHATVSGPYFYALADNWYLRVGVGRFRRGLSILVILIVPFLCVVISIHPILNV